MIFIHLIMTKKFNELKLVNIVIIYHIGTFQYLAVWRWCSIKKSTSVKKKV